MAVDHGMTVYHKVWTSTGYRMPVAAVGSRTTVASAYPTVADCLDPGCSNRVPAVVDTVNCRGSLTHKVVSLVSCTMAQSGQKYQHTCQAGAVGIHSAGYLVYRRKYFVCIHPVTSVSHRASVTSTHSGKATDNWMAVEASVGLHLGPTLAGRILADSQMILSTHRHCFLD